MLPGDDFSTLFAARLLELLAEYTPWHRRLWGIGTALSLREADESIVAVQEAVLIDRAAREACLSAAEKAKDDPGVGTAQHYGALQSALHAPPLLGSLPHQTIRVLAEEIEREYLRRWATALDNPQHTCGVERAARAIASHLLDLGFSQDFLHRWWYGFAFKDPQVFTVSDLLRMLDDSAHLNESAFEVLVVFTAMPRSQQQRPPGTIQAEDINTWLQNNGHDPETLQGVRHAGGAVLSVSARDVYAAADRAAEIVDLFAARVLVGVGRGLDAIPRVWIAGFDKPLRLRRRRRVEVRSLERHTKLYDQAAASPTDSALALLSRLDGASPPTAAAAGWAAVESIFKAPGDEGAHLAADRIGSIATCSFARRELTSLASHRLKGVRDQFSHDLRRIPDTRDQARAIADLLRAGGDLAMPKAGDVCAQARMREVVVSPDETLVKVRRYITDSVRRLYRQRNLVMHGGRTEAVALRATLRGAAPLVGAAFDVVAHQWFENQTDPLRVAAQAEVAFEVLKGPGQHDVTRLIELAAQ
jgi:hypothetical protein